MAGWQVGRLAGWQVGRCALAVTAVLIKFNKILQILADSQVLSIQRVTVAHHHGRGGGGCLDAAVANVHRCLLGSLVGDLTS